MRTSCRGFTDQHFVFSSKWCSVAQQVQVVLTGFECVTQMVCQYRQLPYRQLLSAQTENSSLPHHWQEENTVKKIVSTLLSIFLQSHSLDMMNVCCVYKRDLLLHSFTGIPSIFALMSFLFFLMAERTASSRKPGHLSSFMISLQKHTITLISNQFFKTQN